MDAAPLDLRSSVDDVVHPDGSSGMAGVEDGRMACSPGSHDRLFRAALSEHDLVNPVFWSQEPRRSVLRNRSALARHPGDHSIVLSTTCIRRLVDASIPWLGDLRGGVKLHHLATEFLRVASVSAKRGDFEKWGYPSQVPLPPAVTGESQGTCWRA